MRRGELTGTTAAAIFNKAESDYVGIENWGFYEEGLKLYLQALGAQEELLSRLSAFHKELEGKKKEHYSEMLLKTDQMLAAFYEEMTDLMPVLEHLAGIKAPEEGSEIEALVHEGRLDKTHDSVEREVKNIAKAVKTFLQSRKVSAKQKELLRQ